MQFSGLKETEKMGGTPAAAIAQSITDKHLPHLSEKRTLGEVMLLETKMEGGRT